MCAHSRLGIKAAEVGVCGCGGRGWGEGGGGGRRKGRGGGTVQTGFEGFNEIHIALIHIVRNNSKKAKRGTQSGVVTGIYSKHLTIGGIV